MEITKHYAFHFTSGPHAAGLPLLARFSQKENKTSQNMAVTPTKTYQFARNQCIACNGIIHDRNHTLLLFGSSREAEKTRLNFENLTRIVLNADDPYPKKICVPCKIKLESAIGYRQILPDPTVEKKILGRRWVRV